MQLLVDYGRLENIQVIQESKNDGFMMIRGIFARANEFNNNNRRYPKAVLEREVQKLQPLINEHRLLGECEHPERMSVSLMNASHLVTKLAWQGDILIGEAKILNTPSGKVAQQLIKDGVKIGVSSRGLGTLKECKEFPGKFEVNEDYRAVTFDLVADPSTKGAFPGLVNESTQILLEKTKKEVAAQNLMIRLFESKMQEVKSDKIKKLFEGSRGTKRAARINTAGQKKGAKGEYVEANKLLDKAAANKKAISTKKALKGKVPYNIPTPPEYREVSKMKASDSSHSAQAVKGFKERVKLGSRKAFDWDKRYPTKNK